MPPSDSSNFLSRAPGRLSRRPSAIDRHCLTYHGSAIRKKRWRGGLSDDSASTGGVPIMPSTTASRFVRRSFVLLLACAAPVALSAAPPPTAPAEAKPLYKDASAPIDARVDDLLKRMTLEEKGAQLLTVWQEKTTMR